MITIFGKYYDGKVSAQIGAVLKVYDNGVIRIENEEDGQLLLSTNIQKAQLSDRIADIPRVLTFADHGTFETPDNAAVDGVIKQHGGTDWSRWVHILESRKRFVLLAAVLVIAFAVAMVRYGIPAAAQVIAGRLPNSLYQMASEQTLAILDKAVFKPTELSETQQARIGRHFQPLVDRYRDLGIRVLFRKGGKIGPNAFALPDGVIVFTDEMVQLSEHDDELLAVFAHEIGHVHHQHAMRRMVQDSLLSFAILAFTGDAAGVSELFLGLPVVLTELAYSRDFEREADRFGLAFLVEQEIPARRFADLLERIEEKDAQKDHGQEQNWTGYLSTHPPTKERLKLFYDADEKTKDGS